MRGPVKPYLYSNQQERYSDPFNTGFDPKAVTRASWAPPPAPRPKQEGPLINFNRHPDSWQQAPYGSTNAIPLSKNTKRNVKAVRWVQLFLRTVNFLGATGTIVCVAMLSNVQGVASWATRAAPAVDLIFALYGIVHLARRARSKAPGSAASYHIFAILMDLTLIPFYVYIALSDRWNISQPLENKARWRSLLKSQAITDDLINYTWIIATVIGGLHLVTSGISVYLARMFRKISNLPPDLNPLEDNLTSRRKSKHKYKNSDMTEVTGASGHDKHDSGVCLPWEDEKRPVSFIATRNEADQLYSPHNPRTANESRISLPVSAPSIADTHPGSPVSTPSIVSKSSSEGLSHIDIIEPSKPPPRAGSPLKQTSMSRMNSVAASSVYSDHSSQSKGSAPGIPRKSSKRVSGTFTSTENWSVFKDENEHDENSEPAFSTVPEEDDEDLSEIDIHDRNSKRPYQLVRQSSFLEGDDLGAINRSAPTPKSPVPPPHRRLWDTNAMLRPLQMNPPTPPLQAARGDTSRPTSRNSGSAVSLLSENAPPNRTPTMGRYYSNLKSGTSRPNTHGKGPSAPLITTSGNAASRRNSPSPSPTKSRYYGDLQSAVHGVRSSPQSSPKAKRPISYPTQEPGLRINEWLTPTQNRENEKRRERQERGEYVQVNNRMDGKGRVVSRSGIDLSEGGYWEDVEPEWGYGGNGMRNVSGKIVEEGRGGWARRRISGR